MGIWDLGRQRRVTSRCWKLDYFSSVCILRLKFDVDFEILWLFDFRNPTYGIFILHRSSYSCI
jgi:hypothetical protein